MFKSFNLSCFFIEVWSCKCIWYFKKKIKSGIKRFEGEVSINNQNVTKNKKKIKVPKNSIIETGELSSLMFVDAKDAFLLRSNTILKIKHHKNKKRIVGFEVIKGGVLSVFSKKKRKIRTPSALIGIRGTGVYIEVDKEKTYICTCYGKAILQRKDNLDIKETVKTSHHDEPRYIYIDKNNIEKAPVINHTDLELIMLEEQVLRKPPFVGKDGKVKAGYY